MRCEPSGIGYDDNARQYALREQRAKRVIEKTHIRFNGDYRHYAGIHILPVRVWPCRYGIGHNFMDIAIRCRIHKLPVYALTLKWPCI